MQAIFPDRPVRGLASATTSSIDVYGREVVARGKGWLPGILIFHGGPDPR